MNETELLERVERCRRLAKGNNDHRTIEALHDLAYSYQRQADALGDWAGDVRQQRSAYPGGLFRTARAE